MIPDPNVAAIKENIEPLVPPALNFYCPNLTGESIYKKQKT